MRGGISAAATRLPPPTSLFGRRRQAELSWLSQYPHESEICFPPLTGLTVRERRVVGGALVLELLPRVQPSRDAAAADTYYELFLEADRDGIYS